MLSAISKYYSGSPNSICPSKDYILPNSLGEKINGDLHFFQQTFKGRTVWILRCKSTATQIRKA
ncbi:hypothetical protein LV85_00908 [Algoriphagus chordae]|uniref:Uncharacterized protein n=1 Tax=Algoriphagus chordae TaxID=237019 RepID=A0A2W7R4D0_9BACT|nr:hypothetical protein LV85_00908 [Algoriphagus chordae]